MAMYLELSHRQAMLVVGKVLRLPLLIHYPLKDPNCDEAEFQHQQHLLKRERSFIFCCSVINMGLSFGGFAISLYSRYMQNLYRKIC